MARRSTPGTTGPTGRLWGARHAEPPADAAWRLSASVSFDQRLWREDIESSRAHIDELARIGLVSGKDARALRAALDQCAALLEAGQFPFSPDDEDIHGAIERWLIGELGDLGGRLRAGRSRNDQIANDLRLYVMRACERLRHGIGDVQSALCDLADAHLDWVAPGYTHLQRAQPVLLAHHLLAYVWMLDRDAGRLVDCAGRADESVLGAGALAGSTLSLDPQRYADALGYSRVAANSIDAVASRDFAVELLAACALLAVHLSRFGEEVVIWTSAEFGFATVSDAYSTGSSIMPQKRNPDIAELVRGKAGRIIGDLVALLTVLKGLPLAYDRDLQEDKEAVFDAVDTLELVLPAVAGMVAGLTFDRDRLAAAAAGGSTLATDLAEELVQRGVPFRQAHESVGRLVTIAERQGTGLEELTAEEVAAAHPVLDLAAAELLDVRVAIERRAAPFATASSSVGAQLRAARRAADANLGG